ncbi:uncharacterized protein LOC121389676 [Gigantopelta aegis]|uniref:uncharacterized protein LOC121389676 n=1 Tax=Gigantopelta aegis TaxID=1735272 RepID=UPI001B88A4EF|nr:uncharacterized protein LOC121389676 [Gigantopelta aegis]
MKINDQESVPWGLLLDPRESFGDHRVFREHPNSSAILGPSTESFDIQWHTFEILLHFTDCHKGSKYDAKAKKCICQSGYLGRTCSNTCKHRWNSDATYLWENACVRMNNVWENCQQSCSGCRGGNTRHKCKNNKPNWCLREMLHVLGMAKRKLCFYWKENCPRICLKSKTTNRTGKTKEMKMCFKN